MARQSIRKRHEKQVFWVLHILVYSRFKRCRKFGRETAGHWCLSSCLAFWLLDTMSCSTLLKGACSFNFFWHFRTSMDDCLDVHYSTILRGLMLGSQKSSINNHQYVVYTVIYRFSDPQKYMYTYNVYIYIYTYISTCTLYIHTAHITSIQYTC